jgi:hypothetical protein
MKKKGKKNKMPKKFKFWYGWVNYISR